MQALLIHRPYLIPDFVVLSDDLRVLHRIQAMQTPFAAIVDNPSEYIASGGKRISITSSSSSFTVCYEDVVYATEDPLQIVENILFEHTRTAPDYFALHAAAVGYRGKAYIFAGRTGAGKTTLSVYLAEKGLDYITDDCVLIHRDNLKVYPFQKAVHLRKGGLNVLKAYGIYPPTVDIHNLIEDRFMYLPAGACEKPYEIGGIYFLQYNSSENNEELFSFTDSLSFLLKQSLFYETPSPSLLILINKIAAYGCHKLLYRDMEYVYQMIAETGDRYQ